MEPVKEVRTTYKDPQQSLAFLTRAVHFMLFCKIVELAYVKADMMLAEACADKNRYENLDEM